MIRRTCRRVVALALLALLPAAPALADDALRGSVATQVEPWPMDFGASGQSVVIVVVAARTRPTFGVVGRLQIVSTEDAGRFSLSQDDTAETTSTAKGKFPSKPVDYFLLVLLAEGLIAANSYLATLSPDVYGGLAILLAPFAGAFCEQCNTAEAVVGGLGLGGIGVYNLTLDEDELSSNDIFWRNFVAWHVVAGAIGIAYAASEHRHGRAAGSKEDTREHDWSLNVFPVRDGLAVSYTYRY